MVLPNAARRSCAVLLFALLAAIGAMPPEAAAQVRDGLQVGLRLEQNASTMPGIEIGVQRDTWLGGRPRLTFSYGTTRLATAFGSNDLVKDRLQLGAAWHFRPRHRLSPYVQLSGGYERFDREDEDLFALLDNTAWMATLAAGGAWRFTPRLALRADAGLSVLQASTVYPLVTSLGIQFRLP